MKTSGISAGLVRSPKNRKKIAAKRSRNGASLTLATIATSPVSINPTRNAATAPENPIYVARPDATRAAPNTVNHNVAESPMITGACGTWNPFAANINAPPAISSATEIEINPVTNPTAAARALSIGK